MRSKRILWVVVAAGLLVAWLAARLAPDVEQRPVPVAQEPIPKINPTPPSHRTERKDSPAAEWEQAAYRFTSYCAQGAFRAAAAVSTPEMGRLIRLSGLRLPGLPERYETVSKGESWADVRITLDAGDVVVVSVAYDGARWVVADIEPA